MSADPSIPPAALSGEVRLPEKLADVEPVRSVRTPIRLEYDFIPGEASSGYLKRLRQPQDPRPALAGGRGGVRPSPRG